jgi:uncharacterized membrane protein
MDYMSYEQRLDKSREEGQVETSVNIQPTERKLSTFGGAALLLAGLARRRRSGLGLAAMGVSMLMRGITGVSALYKLIGRNTAVHSEKAAISVPHQQGIRVVESITINRPVEEIYSFWRDFSNLPRVIPHLESVKVLSDTRSHWKVKGPAGMNVAWDAEIVNEEPNTVIGWRSMKNPYVDHAGSVRFNPAPANQSTEVQVEMEYLVVGGPAGAAIARLFGDAPQQQVSSALSKLKQHFEVGEVATSSGQSSG